MKAIIRLIIASIMTASLATAVSATSQKGAETGARKRQTRRSDSARARSLFVNKSADAMRVVILKADGDTYVPTDPGQEFKQGDQIKVDFYSNFKGYVYIVNVAPSGQKCVLFPYAEEADNQIAPDKAYTLPRTGAIQFDEEKGTEVLQVIMSRDRIAFLDAATKNENGCITDSASSVANELAGNKGGLEAEKTVSVLPKSGPHALRSRDIILAAGKDKEPEGSYVAISDSNGSNGTLKSGEVVVFDIRLKHN